MRRRRRRRRSTEVARAAAVQARQEHFLRASAVQTACSARRRRRHDFGANLAAETAARRAALRRRGAHGAAVVGGELLRHLPYVSGLCCALSARRNPLAVMIPAAAASIGRMQQAIREAKNALERGEVPVGCVLCTADGTVVARGSNRTNERGNAASHAEMVAFEQLSELKRVFAPGELTLFVTCEPCIMCAAAIVQMQVVGHIVYGCSNPRFGGCGSVRSLRMYERSPRVHVPTVRSGVEAATAVQLLGEFYKRSNPHAPKPKRRRVRP